MGDSRYKKPKTSQNFVTADPHHCPVIHLDPSHKFIIFACDGLWDVCSQEDAAKYVDERFKEGKSVQKVSELLVQHALDLGTEDNVTVVIVKIDWENENTGQKSATETEATEKKELENTSNRPASD